MVYAIADICDIVLCDFDNGDFCNLEQLANGDDEFDWTINRGHTASSATGPSVDGNGSDEGNISY